MYLILYFCVAVMKTIVEDAEADLTIQDSTFTLIQLICFGNTVI